MKKWVFAIAIVLLFIFMVPGAHTYANDSPSDSEIIEKMQSELKKCESSFNVLIQDIIQNEQPSVDVLNRIVVFLDSHTELRPHYGGVYLNTEKAPVLCLTTIDEKVVQSFVQAADSEKLVIQTVLFSYDELEEIMAKMNQLCSSNESSLSKYISAFSEDIEQNKIIVELKANTPENQMAVMSVLDCDPLLFSFTDGCFYSEAVSVLAGNRIQNAISNYTVFKSVGFRGYRIDSSNSLHYGFASCGHDSFNPAYYGGQAVGYLFDSINSGQYDFFFL